MPIELTVHAVHQGGMKVGATAGDHSVMMDYPLKPNEQIAGFTPMQLLLASLAGCTGSVVALTLGRANQPITQLEVNVRGTRRDEHPTIFTDIAVEFVVHGEGVAREAVDKALAHSERICPVYAMIKAATPITSTIRMAG